MNGYSKKTAASAYVDFLTPRKYTIADLCEMNNRDLSVVMNRINAHRWSMLDAILLPTEVAIVSDKHRVKSDLMPLKVKEIVCLMDRGIDMKYYEEHPDIMSLTALYRIQNMSEEEKELYRNLDTVFFAQKANDNFYNIGKVLNIGECKMKALLKKGEKNVR